MAATPSLKRFHLKPEIPTALLCNGAGYHRYAGVFSLQVSFADTLQVGERDAEDPFPEMPPAFRCAAVQAAEKRILGFAGG